QSERDDRLRWPVHVLLDQRDRPAWLWHAPVMLSRRTGQARHGDISGFLRVGRSRYVSMSGNNSSGMLGVMPDSEQEAGLGTLFERVSQLLRELLGDGVPDSAGSASPAVDLRALGEVAE